MKSVLKKLSATIAAVMVFGVVAVPYLWSSFPMSPVGQQSPDGWFEENQSAVSIARYGNDMSTAKTAIGSTSRRLVINSSVAVSADLEFPATCTISIVEGGLVTVAAGKTLTINSFDYAAAENRQCFAGSGTVVFGSYIIPVVRSSWFATGDTAAGTIYAAGSAPLWVKTDGSVDGITENVDAATTTAAGKIELATQEEVNTATDATRAVAPSTLGKAQASGMASLNSSSLVVQNPANATSTATANKIPIADGSGKLDTWVSDSSATVKGKIEIATNAETYAKAETDKAIVPSNLPQVTQANVDYIHRYTDNDLEAAVTAIGATPTKLIIDGTTKATTSNKAMSIPATCTVSVVDGGLITTTGFSDLSIRSATYKWTQSSTTTEYYLELAAGGDPGINQPTSVLTNTSTLMTEGTVGSLAAGQWDWGDNDSLGYNTVYVYTGKDPDSEAAGYYKARYSLTIGRFDSAAAGLRQVFGTDGSVLFGKNAVDELFPQWFGAVGDAVTDDATAIQNTVNASQGCGTINFGSHGRFLVKSTVSYYNPTGLKLTSTGFEYGGTANRKVELISNSLSTPIIQFINASQHCLIENLGFTNGAIAIQFTRTADASGALAHHNWIRRCVFINQSTASIIFGYQLTDVYPAGNDDFDSMNVQECYFGNSETGVLINCKNNSYHPRIDRCTFGSGITGNAIKMKNVNDISIRDTLPLVSDFANSEYAIDLEACGGSLSLDNIYSETPLLLKTTTWTGDTAGVAYLKNIHINSSNADPALVAIDMNQYTILENVQVTTLGTPNYPRVMKFANGYCAVPDFVDADNPYTDTAGYAAGVTKAGKLKGQSLQIASGAALGKVLRSDANGDLTYDIIDAKNIIQNSQFGVWSNGTVSNVGAAIWEDDCADDGTALWTAGDVTLTFDTDHYVYDPSAGGNSIKKLSLAVTKGKLYRVSCDIKDGTGSTTDLKFIFYDGAFQYSPALATTAGWATKTWVVECATTTTNTGQIGVYDDTNFANNINIKNFSFYEITPATVAADALAADGHSKTSTLDAYRVAGDATHVSGGYYGLELIKGADSAEYYNLNTRTDRAFLDTVKGRTVSMGCYVYSVTATDNVKLQIYDGVGTTESAFVGADALTWVEISRSVSASATEFTPRVLCDGDTSDVAYISPVVVQYGSSIGAGNYAPRPGEIIHCEVVIALTDYTATTSAADATINLEAQSSGKIPKGAKAVLVKAYAKDSAAGDGVGCDFQTSSGVENGLTLDTQVNNIRAQGQGWVACDTNGDIYFDHRGSGASALTVDAKVIAVQIN